MFQQRLTIYSKLGLEFNIRIFPNKLKTLSPTILLQMPFILLQNKIRWQYTGTYMQ